MTNQTVNGNKLPNWHQPEKIWNSMFVSVFFANMAFGMGQMMSNSLLSVYADYLGAPASQIGILMGMFALTALMFRFVAGPALDSFNRKYLLMGSITVMAVAYVGYSISDSMGMLMVFRLLQGIGIAFGNVCCFAIVADALPPEKFNTGMGYYSIAQIISQAIGPTVGLQLVSWFGYQTTYVINAGVMVIALLIATTIRIPARPHKQFKMKLHNIIAKEALAPTAITFFIAMGFTTITALLLVSAKKQGVTEGIGLFFTFSALTMLVSRPLVGKLTDKYGFVKVAVPSILITALSFVIISQADTLWMYLAAAVVNSCGYGAVQPALQSLVMKSVPPDRRGSASSTNFIGMDSATLIGPTVAGVVAEIFGYSAMWLVMVIPLLIGTALVLIFRRNINHIEDSFSRTIN